MNIQDYIAGECGVAAYASPNGRIYYRFADADDAYNNLGVGDIRGCMFATPNESFTSVAFWLGRPSDDILVLGEA